MKKDEKESFIQALDKLTIQIYFLTTAFLLVLYAFLVFNKENIDAEWYIFLTSICVNIIAVLIGIVISYFAFSYSRKITDKHKQEELAVAIAERVSESTKMNEFDEQVSSNNELTYSIFKDERYNRWYLQDRHGTFRLIEDRNTLLYFLDVFNIKEEVDFQDIPSLAKVISFPIGAPVPMISRWKPPITLEEQEIRDLEQKVRKWIDIEEKELFENRDSEDCFVFSVVNKSNYGIIVKSVSLYIPTYKSRLFSNSDISRSNEGEDGSFYLLFEGGSVQGTLNARSETKLRLWLRKKYSAKDYEKLRTSIVGDLVFKVDYQEKELEIRIFDV
jgi:hypothetical protein